MDTVNAAATSGQPAPDRAAPQHGERAADLLFDAQAGKWYGGAWIYPACYDDFHLARRRAYSLSQGFGIPFNVDLFGAAGEAGALTPSVAVSEPGYYAFTTHDPRPHVVHIGAQQSGEEGSGSC